MAQQLETEQEQQQQGPPREAQVPNRGGENSGRGADDKAQAKPEQDGPPERRRSYIREHPGRVVIFMLVAVAIGIGVFMWWSYSSSYESTDDAEVDGHIYPVSPRISGRVTKVNVDNNQRVKQGEVLVQLDPTDYQVATQRAQADLSQEEANTQAAITQIPITTNATSSQVSGAGAGVEEAVAGVSVAEQQYQAASARVREADANYVKAQRDVERYRPLVDKQEISQQQFDQAVAAANALKATVDTARASADAASRQVIQARARVSQAQAQQAATRSGPQQVAGQRARAASSRAAADEARAVLEQAKLNISYTNVVAPIDGLAGQRSVEVGQQVQVGQALLSVVPLNNLWITANFKETQLKNMRPGQRVTVHVDATGRDYNGHVDSFPGATGSKYSLLPPENATGNYVKVVQRLPVRILLEKDQNQDLLLRPGMSAEPKVWIR